MKTLDEVIKALEYCNQDSAVDCTKCAYEGVDCQISVMLTDALQYLKLYQIKRDELYDLIEEYRREVKGKNDPLTWDELREMEGKPVWVEIESDKRWEIVEKTGENGWAEGEWLETNDSLYRREEQGETWQAYRKERE